MKRLGIIGGLGPMATAHFFRLIVEMTSAATDQEHIEILIHNCPAIPDRTEYLLGQSSENPLGQMISVGKGLAAAGAEVLALPCITAHYFHRELEEGIRLPVLNAVAETAAYLRERGIQRAGIMATEATAARGLLSAELDRAGIQGICPDQEGQKMVTYIIYDNVKAARPVNMEYFLHVSEQLFAKGAQVILLGCTELSMIKNSGGLGAGYLDMTELLAKCCVEYCGTLKEEYRELITGQYPV